MPGCIVFGCLSGSGREKDKYALSLLPKSPKVRMNWLKKINRSIDYEFVENMRICHKHFKEDDFILNSENSGSRGRLLKVAYSQKIS